MAVPRREYVRPQFQRDVWVCLNAEREFEIHAGDSGFERGLLDRPNRVFREGQRRTSCLRMLMA